jgi:hypothetical protein
VTDRITAAEVDLHSVDTYPDMDQILDMLSGEKTELLNRVQAFVLSEPEEVKNALEPQFSSLGLRLVRATRQEKANSKSDAKKKKEAEAAPKSLTDLMGM